MPEPSLQPTAAARDGAADDRAYIDAMEARRAASLRRRVMWFCIIGIFLMSIATLGSIPELLGMPIDADPSATALNSAPRPLPEGPVRTGWWGVRPGAVITFASCASIVVIFAWGLVYAVRTRPYSESQAQRMAENTGLRSIKGGRHRLVVALSLICLLAFTVEFPAEIAAQWCDLNWGSPAAARKVMDEPELAGWRAINSYGIFFCLACIAVPMRWRESLRIAVPGLGLLLMTLVFGLNAEGRVITGLIMWAVAYALLGMGWSAWRYADFDARLRAHALGTRYTDLHGQVSEISAELKEARRLHESLFPAPSVAAEGPICVDYRYQPARHIGGDFLFVHREQAQGDRPGAATIVVIDVSGHGVAAALAVNRLHGELLRFFSHYPRVEREAGGPGHLLSDMNTYACAALAPQGVYATALIVRVDPAQGRLWWASAGHPTGFLLRRAEGAVDPIADLPSTATMLGVLPPELYDADEHSAPMSPGDCLLAYTDGAVESRDAKGQDFTPERLRAVLAGLRGPNAKRPLIDTLMSAVEAHRHGRITDDTLLVEIELRSPLPPSQGGAATAAPHEASRT